MISGCFAAVLTCANAPRKGSSGRPCWLWCSPSGSSSCPVPRGRLLLLDDVMSELDPSRRRRLIAFTRRGGQTVITTTDLRYFSPEELEQARIIDLGPAETDTAGAAAPEETADG